MSSSSHSDSQWVDEGAPLRIVKGSVLSAVGGSAVGATIGVLQAKPGALFAYRMGLNTFAFAFPFFCLREYLISPSLAKALPGSSWANHSGRVITDARQPISNPHTRNLASSAISGAAVGSFFGAIRRGYRPIAFFKGATTFSVACIALQLAGNETRFLGTKLFTASKPQSNLKTSSSQVSLPERDPSKPFVISNSSSNAEENLSNSEVSLREPISNPSPSRDEAKSIEQPSFWSKFSLASLAPVRKVSNDEYERKLQTRLRSIEERLREVEAEINEVS